MNIIRDPTVAGAPTALGSATVENRSTFRRRVMQVVTLPLKSTDNYRLGDPVTVVDSGTGVPERCQVEGWAMPYPDGAERIIRLTYPAILPASDLRAQHAFQRSDGSQLPPFILRDNVRDGLENLVIDFFAGPKETGSADHWVIAKNAGALPAPIYDGTRSRVYRWFQRIWHPSHNPALETEWWTEIDVEVFHDEDYATVWWMWGVCNPDRTDPNGVWRGAWTDEETEVGYDFKPGVFGQHSAVPVIFFPEQNVQGSVFWNAGQAKYRWVHDRRTLYLHQPEILNEFVPWGTAATIKGAILFRGASGNLGDELRDDSVNAWATVNWPVLGIANTWKEKEEAYGPIGMMRRRPKRHEHPDRTRDAEYVRQQLETQSVALVTQASDRSVTKYAFNIQLNSLGMNLCGLPASTTTGDHPAWVRNPMWAAIIYQVPGLGLHCERFVSVQPKPMFFRESNGDIVSCFDHPNMNIDRMQPTTVGPSPDMLGKSGNPLWRTPGQQFRVMRAPSGSAILPGTIGYDGGSANSHFEDPNLVMVPAVFGDRGIAKIAEHVCYTGFLGDWAAQAWTVGETGQARAFARGCTMSAWFMWFFGRDTRHADRAYDALYSHFYLPANNATSNSFGLSPTRLVKTLNIFRRTGNASVNSVNLDNFEFHRPWEDCHGMVGWSSLARLGAHLRSELAVWNNIAIEMCRDALRYGSPRRVDEATGSILATYLSPGHGYQIAAAAAIVDFATRPLSEADIMVNSTSLCGGSATRCTEALKGYLLLEAPGVDQYMTQQGGFAMDMVGAVGDITLTRYVPDGWFSQRDTIIGGNHLVWLNGQAKWHMGWAEHIIFGATTTQGTHGLDTLSGITTSILYPFNAWMCRTNTSVVKRIDRRNGGLILDLIPPYEPAQGWADVKCVTIAGENYLALLDGIDTAQSRQTYRILSVTEQSPTVQLSLVTFSFSDGLGRDVRAFAWDPNVNEYVLAASRDGITGFFRLAPQGGTAIPDARIVVDRRPGFEYDIWSMDIDQDGRIMVVSNSNANWQAYAYASGGYWGSSRSWHDMVSGDNVVCFNRRARTDDAQRVISASNGAAFHEVEV